MARTVWHLESRTTPGTHSLGSFPHTPTPLFQNRSEGSHCDGVLSRISSASSRLHLSKKKSPPLRHTAHHEDVAQPTRTRIIIAVARTVAPTTPPSHARVSKVKTKAKDASSCDRLRHRSRVSSVSTHLESAALVSWLSERHKVLAFASS